MMNERHAIKIKKASAVPSAVGQRVRRCKTVRVRSMRRDSIDIKRYIAISMTLPGQQRSHGTKSGEHSEKRASQRAKERCFSCGNPKLVTMVAKSNESAEANGWM